MVNKNKKTFLLVVIGIILLIGTLGLTYAFFNYTRTGASNNIRVGNINFSFGQTNTINLTNVFPIASNSLDSTNSGEVLLNISGNTDYTGGLEYLLTIEDANITVGTGNNQKNIPVKIVVTPEKNGDLGTELPGKMSINYWQSRGGSTAYYTLLNDNYVYDKERLLAGYIPSGANGVIATIGIKAFLDIDDVAISDTYQGCSWQFDGGTWKCNYPDAMETLDEWVDERTVLTTDEWNSFANTPISFKIKVEANEGTWVDSRIIEISTNDISVSNKNITTDEYSQYTTATFTFMEPGGKYKYEIIGFIEEDLENGDERSVMSSIKEYKLNSTTNEYVDITNNLEVNTIILHPGSKCSSYYGTNTDEIIIGNEEGFNEFFGKLTTRCVECLMNS